jgi:hypothetical protein
MGSVKMWMSEMEIVAVNESSCGLESFITTKEKHMKNICN